MTGVRQDFDDRQAEGMRTPQSWEYLRQIGADIEASLALALFHKSLFDK
jgi:hypothetical protein